MLLASWQTAASKALEWCRCHMNAWRYKWAFQDKYNCSYIIFNKYVIYAGKTLKCENATLQTGIFGLKSVTCWTLHLTPVSHNLKFKLTFCLLLGKTRDSQSARMESEIVPKVTKMTVSGKKQSMGFEVPW